MMGRILPTLSPPLENQYNQGGSKNIFFYRKGSVEELLLKKF